MAVEEEELELVTPSIDPESSHGTVEDVEWEEATHTARKSVKRKLYVEPESCDEVCIYCYMYVCIPVFIATYMCVYVCQEKSSDCKDDVDVEPKGCDEVYILL